MEQMVPDQQARLDFLEAAVPVLIQQRNDALDREVRAKAESAMQVRHLQAALAKAEERLKDSESRPPNPTVE